MKTWGLWKPQNNNVKDVKERQNLLHLFTLKEFTYVTNIKYKIVGENVATPFSFIAQGKKKAAKFQQNTPMKRFKLTALQSSINYFDMIRPQKWKK